MVKTRGEGAALEPLSLAAPVKTAVMRIDPGIPVSRIQSMEHVVADSTGQRRFPMLLLSLFSGASATIACFVPARRAASVDPLVVLREE